MNHGQIGWLRTHENEEGFGRQPQRMRKFENGMLVGQMKTLVFYQFNGEKKISKDATKTSWIMHEYSLVNNAQLSQFEHWVLYGIIHHKNNDLGKQYDQKKKVVDMVSDHDQSLETRRSQSVQEFREYLTATVEN
nr:TPA_asm: hypothetical protein HUJ06_002283 [Nelumbo nucifera]